MQFFIAGTAELEGSIKGGEPFENRKLCQALARTFAIGICNHEKLYTAARRDIDCVRLGP